jgi:hypothetical protein
LLFGSDNANGVAKDLNYSSVKWVQGTLHTQNMLWAITIIPLPYMNESRPT